MVKEKIDTLVIIGKKWFQKTYGNTYHTATIEVNGRFLKSKIKYGYGNQYLLTAAHVLRDAGYDIPEDDSDALVFLVKYGYDAGYVSRKKDL